MKKLHTFFSQNINTYAIFNDQSFNGTLTNDIVSFEQLGPDSKTGLMQENLDPDRTPQNAALGQGLNGLP